MGGIQNDAPTYTCGDRAPDDKSGTDLGDLLPVFAASLTPEEPEGTWEGTCMTFNMKYMPVNETQFQVKVTTSNAKSKTCSDHVMFATPNFIHFEHYFGLFHGNTLTF